MKEAVFNADAPTCPHCGYVMEEWWRRISGNESEIVDCDKCNKKFEIEPEVTYSFDTFAVEGQQ